MVGTDAVAVGSWVLVRDGQVEELLRIVPLGDAEPVRRRISDASPVARALLGHQAGEQVRVWGPERRTLSILRVWSEGDGSRVVGGDGAPPERWQDVLEGAEALRIVRPPDEDGVTLYEVLTASGGTRRYLVEE